MKYEICAEVHAKVAYSMRIMLDKLREDLKLSFKPLEPEQTASNNEECFCKDINKCNEKLAALFAMQHAMMKKEKKQSKRANQELKKCNKVRKNFVSESDTDNEKSGEQNFSTNNLPALLSMYDPTKVPPVPPRKTSPLRKLSVTESNLNSNATLASSKSSELLLCNKEHKLLNGPAEPDCEENPAFEDQADKSVQADSSASSAKTGPENVLPDDGELQKKETQLSPSDSEFEVISMPPNINPVSEYARCKISRSNINIMLIIT